jgi:hypothetical protein
MAGNSILRGVFASVLKGLNEYGRSEMERKALEADSEEEADFWHDLLQRSDAERRMNRDYADA